MADENESGRTRNERRDHDREARTYEASTGNPYHLPRVVRGAAVVLVLIVVVALTALFASGAFHW